TNPNLVWGVNGIQGGDATIGTISAEGGYTAPAKVPVPATVTVTVADRDDPTVSASASVTIVPPTSAEILAGSVSVAYQPVVTAVSPAAASRGSSDLAVTITGAGFSGVSSLNFLLHTTNDANITVTNLGSNSDGTQVTAVISIAASAVIGPRVVQVVTPSRTSTAAGIGGDLFSVQ